MIVESARQHQTITYGDIMRRCHIPRGQPIRNGKAIGDVVGNLSEWTWETWGIYISAIVVHANTGYPGGGFFGLRDIPSKFFREEAGWQDARLGSAERSFVHKCQLAVFTWAKRRKV